MADAIKALVGVCDEDQNRAKGLRDRALILVGFAGAFRRSELALVDIADLKWVELGLEVTIPVSKTDQTGEGILKTVSKGESEFSCPVRSLKSWLDFSGIESDWVFRPVNRHGQIQETADLRALRWKYREDTCNPGWS